MSRLSQETLAILGASIALAALIFTSTAGMRAEMHDIRAEIHNVRTEIHTVRDEIHTVRAEIHDVRAEARANRETFERHIIRLTEQQGILIGHMDSLRTLSNASSDN